MKKLPILLIIITLVTPTLSYAHPGGTDSSGCHTCRTNCAKWGLSTGEYHCHQSKGVPQPVAPVKSIKAEQKTVPAPEYAIPKKETENRDVKVESVHDTVTEPIVIPSENNTANKSWFVRFFSWLFQ